MVFQFSSLMQYGILINHNRQAICNPCLVTQYSTLMNGIPIFNTDAVCAVWNKLVRNYVDTGMQVPTITI